MERDKAVTRQLQEAGWTVLRFWEWQIKKHLDECVEAVKQTIASAERKEGAGISQNGDDMPHDVC